VTSESQTLNLMLYNFAKYQLSAAKLNRLTNYRVINKCRKFRAKIFLHYTDIVIFMLWYFILNHPAYTVSSMHI